MSAEITYTVTCDRCAAFREMKKLTAGEVGNHLRPAGWHKIVLMGATIDLCHECVEELREWLRAPSEADAA